jgi:hypothetical protein
MFNRKKLIIEHVPNIDECDTTITYQTPKIYVIDKRKCYSSNYIPHKTPTFRCYEKWKYSYSRYINDLYVIFCNIIHEKFEENIDWECPKVKEMFNKFIYKCSSKYISKYLEC